MKWVNKKVGDLCKVGRGSSPRPIKDPRYFEDGHIPWIKVADATASGKYLHETREHVNEFGASFSRLLPINSLIVCTSGTLGHPVFLGVEGCIHDGWLYTYDYRGLDPHFFYYFLKARRDYFLSVAYGVAIQNINTKILRNTPILLPPLSEQKRIAFILSTYDDLIENNRRRIQLLEQATRLLYKEWFIHLRFPGHQHTTITNGIPEGWDRTTLGDVCETVGGGTPSTKISENWGGDITWVVPTDVTKNNCLALLDSERKITESGLRTSSTKIVPAETILMTSRASVGFFALMDKPVCTNQGFINIIPHYEEIRMYLLFNLINRVAEIRSNAKGTTYPEISKQRFRQMDIVIPSKALAVKFANIASNIIQQERILKRSIFRLTEARDLLLPRLIRRKGNLLPNAMEAI